MKFLINGQEIPVRPMLFGHALQTPHGIIFYAYDGNIHIYHDLFCYPVSNKTLPCYLDNSDFIDKEKPMFSFVPTANDFLGCINDISEFTFEETCILTVLNEYHLAAIFTKSPGIELPDTDCVIFKTEGGKYALQPTDFENIIMPTSITKVIAILEGVDNTTFLS